ncbi:DivIVA domain-containing protein [Planomonospora sp. ID91781]|uniref:Cell wall synthesis protein Wag31 n=1 Tax=Planomonospora sphaerica TaxID=161355 RepID=A0A171BUW9_9ACTN|nr:MULTISPECIES: DivIVA domain-containing protein [Planomonospora]MBG0821381.1 DivIVA domain-containing protein [Planomonospora sp. ID91781]GAT65612.1 cell division protein DivIVA [Planomonospora sphaerica]
MNRFPRVLGVRYGYDPDQVDALIHRIESTLGRSAPTDAPITADEIREARFRVKLGGYNETAVDYALDAFIVAVETLAAGERAVEKRAVEARTAGHHPAEVPAEAENGPRDGTPDEQEAAVAPPVSAAVPPAPPAVEEAATAAPAVQDPERARAQDPERARAQDPERGPERDQVQGPERERMQGPEQDRPQAPERRPGAGEDGGPGGPGGGEPVLSGEEEAARIERVAFRAGRLGMGYDEGEVDVFLDRVAATLRGTTDQPVTPDDVREARFSTVVFRPGYAVSQVDDFLHELVGVVERHLGR